MPQCNFSNKILLPKFPGLQLPMGLGTLPYTAGRDFKGEAQSPGPPAEGARGPGNPQLPRVSRVPLET